MSREAVKFSSNWFHEQITIFFVARILQIFPMISKGKVEV